MKSADTVAADQELRRQEEAVGSDEEYEEVLIALTFPDFDGTNFFDGGKTLTLRGLASSQRPTCSVGGCEFEGEHVFSLGSQLFFQAVSSKSVNGSSGDNSNGRCSSFLNVNCNEESHESSTSRSNDNESFEAHNQSQFKERAYDLVGLSVRQTRFEIREVPVREEGLG